MPTNLNHFVYVLIDLAILWAVTSTVHRICNSSVSTFYTYSSHLTILASPGQSIKHETYTLQAFTEYFKEVEEESIRDNFVIVYELLDEFMDFGYPQTTDPKVLQE